MESCKESCGGILNWLFDFSSFPLALSSVQSLQLKLKARFDEMYLLESKEPQNFLQGFNQLFCLCYNLCDLLIYIIKLDLKLM